MYEPYARIIGGQQILNVFPVRQNQQFRVLVRLPLEALRWLAAATASGSSSDTGRSRNECRALTSEASGTMTFVS